MIVTCLYDAFVILLFRSLKDSDSLLLWDQYSSFLFEIGILIDWVATYYPYGYDSFL